MNEEITTAVTTAVSSAANDVIDLVGDLLPIALGVFAVFWGIRKGLRFFKSAAN